MRVCFPHRPHPRPSVPEGPGNDDRGELDDSGLAVRAAPLGDAARDDHSGGDHEGGDVVPGHAKVNSGIVKLESRLSPETTLGLLGDDVGCVPSDV